MMLVENLEVELEGFRLSIPRLEVGMGEYLVVLGPSGVGKTILILAIAGIIKPKRGRIVIDGHDVTHLPPEKREIALVPQNYALFPHMTVYENIAYGLRAKKVPKNIIEEKIRTIARRLGIEHLLGRKPATLSGGEQQRVALARALVVQPRVLLLDEPLSALDPRLRLAGRSLLKRLHREVMFTAIHVTHNLPEALHLATKIAYMSHGTLQGVYSPRHFLKSPYAKPYMDELAPLLSHSEQARQPSHME
jgi:molybdate/tungstate transport system ATP-binding protein